MGESKFELLGNKRHQYIQRRVGKRVNNNCLNYTVETWFGVVKHVTIWGGLGGGKVGDLVKTTSTMDKNSYQSILVHHAVPSGISSSSTIWYFIMQYHLVFHHTVPPGIRNISQGFIFLQDNDPKHTSKLCLNYLKTKQIQKALKIMIWPSVT